MNKNNEIVNVMVDKSIIDNETFNRENIIANFEEYFSLISVGLSNFINYEDKNDTGREFYITASIFSEKLDKILEVFDEKIIQNPDFIKIKEKDKDFIKTIRKKRAFKKFKKSKRFRNIKPSFENILNHMGTFKAMSKNDKNLTDYDKVITKLTVNLEATVENIIVIEETIKTIENS